MAAGQGDTGRVWEAGGHTRVGREEGWGRKDRVRPGPEATGQSSGVPDCGLGGGPPLPQEPPPGTPSQGSLSASRTAIMKRKQPDEEERSQLGYN